ncbi:MAG: esterase, partial [Muribaculaceae bacterium]|nr:esterase [Muribaculaceae bacterium]
MKRLLFLLIVALQSVCILNMNAQFHQQPDASGLPGKRGLLNVRSAQYPRLLPATRMEFLVKAPNAKKFQIDLGK